MQGPKPGAAALPWATAGGRACCAGGHVHRHKQGRCQRCHRRFCAPCCHARSQPFWGGARWCAGADVRVWGLRQLLHTEGHLQACPPSPCEPTSAAGSLPLAPFQAAPSSPLPSPLTALLLQRCCRCRRWLCRRPPSVRQMHVAPQRSGCRVGILDGARRAPRTQTAAGCRARPAVLRRAQRHALPRALRCAHAAMPATTAARPPLQPRPRRRPPPPLGPAAAGRAP
mmetsp:Transcript_15965/g.47311  ORF Transcript_15965/g.47311 Transcript_15965/m.47311 type:complete len:227 (+) Transcript_15965:2174-2854(+)